MEPEKRFPLPLIGALVLLVAVGIWWTLSSRGGDEAAADEIAEKVEDPRDKERKPIKPLLSGQAGLDTEPRAAISGTVRDEQGRAIAGARVCATPDGGELEGHDPGFPICTKSGKDGSYAIDELWPIPTRVDASAKSYVPATWSEKSTGGARLRQVRLRAGQTRKDVDLVMRSGGVRVEGVVKDIAGGGIDGAYVTLFAGRWWRGRQGAAVVQTDADGAFEAWVEPGDVRVTARADGYATGSTSAVAPGEFIETFLTPESVLVGEVVHAETGQAVAGVLVTAEGATSGFFSSDEGWGRTNDAGVFRIGGLEPGIYKPSVTDGELYGMAAEQVHLGLGQTSDSVVLRVHPAALVTGVVAVAGTGESCASGSVVLTEIETKRKARAQVGDDGKVTVEALLPGTYTVKVNCTGFVAREDYEDITIEDTSLEDLKWEVDAGLTVAGQVVDGDGEPVRGIAVRAQLVLDEGDERRQTSSGYANTEDDGRFEMTSLLPGQYEVSAGNRWEGRPGNEDPLEIALEEGESVDDLLIELPSTGALRGNVKDSKGQPVAGVEIMANGVESSARGRGRTRDDGSWAIDHILPGEVRVTALGESWGRELRAPGTSEDDLQGQTVEVVAGEEHEVNLVVMQHDGQITGTVVDDLGPVVDAFVSAERISEKAGANAANARRSVRWSWNERPVLTEQDGSFTLANLEEGNYLIRAHRKGGGEAIAEDVAVGTSVKLSIASTGDLAGTVTAGSKPPEQFTIQAVDRVNAVSRRDTYFRSGGKWRLTQMPPGTYTVTATSSDGTAKLDGITIGEGESREDLTLALSGRVTVEGRLVDADSGKPVGGLEVSISSRAGGGFSFMSDQGGKERANVSDSDGRFKVEDAPVGKVRIVTFDRAGGKMSKYQWTMLSRTLPDAPEEQDIGDVKLVASRLEPNQPPGDLGFTLHEWDPTVDDEERTIKVALVRDDGPAADSGLEPGSIITAVDGKSVGGLELTSWYRLTNVPPGTKLSFTVEGAEAPVLVTVGPPR